MADGANVEPQLCSEQFGSGAARGCLVAADGSLQWEAWGWRWWGFPGPFTVKPQGRDGGGVGTPRTASPPLSGLMAVFLPQGFPDSVSPDYLPYQLWDSVQVSLAAWGREQHIVTGEGDHAGHLSPFRDGRPKPRAGLWHVSGHTSMRADDRT